MDEFIQYTIDCFKGLMEHTKLFFKSSVEDALCILVILTCLFCMLLAALGAIAIFIGLFSSLTLVLIGFGMIIGAFFIGVIVTFAVKKLNPKMYDSLFK